MTTTAGRARPITRYGTPVLHRPCAPATVFDAALRDLVADMFASMHAAGGVGLAANQIGVDTRIFVYDCPDATEQNVSGHVINPRLAAVSPLAGTATHPEGRLSVPGPYALLERPALATVTGVDLDGEPITISGTGLLARCLQHEVDHLDGVVYVDRLGPESRRETLAAARLDG